MNRHQRLALLIGSITIVLLIAFPFTRHMEVIQDQTHKKVFIDPSTSLPIEAQVVNYSTVDSFRPFWLPLDASEAGHSQAELGLGIHWPLDAALLSIVFGTTVLVVRLLRTPKSA